MERSLWFLNTHEAREACRQDYLEGSDQARQNAEGTVRHARCIEFERRESRLCFQLKLNRLVITILHSLEIQYARNDGFEVVANPADRVGLDLKQSFYSPRQIASVSNKHRASCDRLEIPDS